MNKDEFFKKYQLDGSLVILDLDANDDDSKFCYEALLAYRNLPLNEFIVEYLDEYMTESEFIESMLDTLDEIISRAKNAKRFIKKRKKTMKEETM
ncbi:MULTISPECIES: hypothetical protein [Pasteurellaceae]|uniref:Uncharacterized protein n=1 Tax=Glaesserella parasuis TaxID=738 RepID=A0AA42EGD6_GLAPU|nr:hypothetical protein [Avibacterium sp. 20-129]MDD2167885.1 hypothetical protein [Glaesserella parasuis]MCW9699478.1 hypothetical protein [Avibacterium sp. 20-129]MDO9665503.1 hypothetical protein [Glaesserella parasuis]MDP0310535.1 hypothetical protein [Glaesserella parasuis]MDP0329828.1 hypothetical protein [Glaesserella parasuis]